MSAVQPPAAERKRVTVLFSDLSGYTALSGQLDPEELKEIMLRLFGSLSRIIESYDGFVERFLGDAVLAVFGVPRTHEDDALRAIRAAREMHAAAAAMSPELEARAGVRLALHSGIESGLVVTGSVDAARGLHGIVGETMNVAARLAELAKSGDVLVGQQTCKQAQGCFEFEELPVADVKGLARPIRRFRLVASKPVPCTTRNLSGVRASLVGRETELAEINAGWQRLRRGLGSVIGVCGEAGAGKSRLAETFRLTLGSEPVRWLEGHSFPYAQNTPYYPLLTLLSQTFQIADGDPPEQVRARIEAALRAWPEVDAELVPYLGSLYALPYPELDAMSPERIKLRQCDAIGAVLRSVARRHRTVVCLEDLHWADSSSLELLRELLDADRYPILFIALYRPTLDLRDIVAAPAATAGYRQIQLADLSPEQAQGMLESLLRTPRVPPELSRFVQERVGGNPFFLEELVNSLLEGGLLVADADGWQLTGPIDNAVVSSSVHGLISARLDHLDRETKRLLQEASVIGRSFLQAVLRRITGVSDLDRCVADLERLDLIRIRSGPPDVEHAFKHVLIQEVVYQGILKKERLELHARTGRAIEQLFKDRLSDFCETLAYHFGQAGDATRAVPYLVESGNKALKHYAVEAAHRYFRQAFGLVQAGRPTTREQQALLIDVIHQWSLVFYYCGDFGGLGDLMEEHLPVVEALGDDARRGSVYAWYGFALFCRERIEDAYRYLRLALELGERTGDRRVIASACTWLTWACADSGLLDEGIAFGERALSLCEGFEGGTYRYFQSLGGMGFNLFYRGDSRKNREIGERLLDYGRRIGSDRCLVVAHINIGLSHLVAGDMAVAAQSFRAAMAAARDPFYLQWPRLFLGICLAELGQIEESEQELRVTCAYGESSKCYSVGSPARLFLGLVLMRRGRMREGLRMVEQKLEDCVAHKRVFGIAWVEYLLGRVFLELATRSEPLRPGVAMRNLGFLLRHLPTARRRAQRHLEAAVEGAARIGAVGVVGQAYLDLGRLCRLRGDRERARQYFELAAETFRSVAATVYLERTQAALQELA